MTSDKYDYYDKTLYDPRRWMEHHGKKLEEKRKHMSGYYLNNPEHPLNGLLKIDENWTTPIAEIDLPLSFETRLRLINTIVKKSFVKGIHNLESRPETGNIFYDFLSLIDSDSAIKEYVSYANELIRYYCANAWSCYNMEEKELGAKCFGNMQTHGQRTYPHYHHGFDGVLITYLTVGGEFDLDLESEGLIVPCKDEDKVKYDPYDHNKNPNALWGRLGERDTENDQNILLLDPRPAISYPFNAKVRSYKPKIGTTIIHPGYLWHESNVFTGNGIRVSIVLNFNTDTESLVVLKGKI